MGPHPKEVTIHDAISVRRGEKVKEIVWSEMGTP